MTTIQRGTVKWFDFAKRYGFVTLDDGVDALLHLSRLKSVNIHEVPIGSTGEFEIEKTDQGISVKRIISPLVPPESDNLDSYVPATVKWFNLDRGYGFLNTLAKPLEDIFIHAVTVKTSSLVELKPNQQVMVVIEQGEKGPKVLHIKAA